MGNNLSQIMSYSKHENCRGCKAFWIFNGEYKCTIGYKMDKGIPSEFCTKPMTFENMDEERQDIIKKARMWGWEEFYI